MAIMLECVWIGLEQVRPQQQDNPTFFTRFFLPAIRRGIIEDEHLVQLTITQTKDAPAELGERQLHLEE